MIIKETKLCESSLQRLKQNLEHGYPMAIVSAELGSLSKSENNKNTQELRQEVKRRFYTYIRMEGSWTYEDENKKSKIEVTEQSTLIMADIYERDNLLKFAQYLGKEFNQESIIFIDTDNRCKLIYTSDTPEHKKNDVIDIGIIHYNEISDMYSSIKGHRFVIKECIYPNRIRNFNHSLVIENLRRHPFVRNNK